MLGVSMKTYIRDVDLKKKRERLPGTCQHVSVGASPIEEAQ